MKYLFLILIFVASSAFAGPEATPVLRAIAIIDNAVGVDVVDLGILPVGAVSRLGRDTGAALGVMVSASHNPAEDNGIKFFGKDGAKLTDEGEASIEARYFSTEHYSRPVASKVGIQTRMHDPIERYVKRVSQTVNYSMRGLEFFVDCANGAAFQAAPASTLQPFHYVVLLWATMFGYLVFGDLPDHWTVLGAVVIAGSGLYAFYRERQLTIE